MRKLLNLARRYAADPSWRPRQASRRPLPLVHSAVAPLEVRCLLSNVPPLIGPTAPNAAPIPPVNPMPPPADGPPDGDLAGLWPGPAGPGDPRLFLQPPTISGPITYLRPPISALAPPASPENGPGDLGIRPPAFNPGGDVPDALPRHLISATRVLVNGTPTPEVAATDDQTNSVTVYLGSQAIFQVNGLNHPEGVKLADINNDGSPDLIIADSGNDDVQIYAGLAGGGFAANAVQKIHLATGDDPAGVTVGDVNKDGLADLIVANKGAHDVLILLGTGAGSRWDLEPSTTVQAGTAPVRTLLTSSPDDPGLTELLICNSESNDVYIYQIGPGGQIGPRPTQIINVGQKPTDMMVGQFGRRRDLDLVTISPASDSLTFVGGVFSPNPTYHTFEATGLHPLSVVPITTDSSGSSDLMLANSDGRLALLQAGDNGLQLTGLIGQTGLSNVTSVATGDWIDGGLALYEASSTSASIAMMQLNFEDLATSQVAAAPAASATDLTTLEAAGVDVEVVPLGGSAIDLAGILWSRSRSTSKADDIPATPGSQGLRQAAQGGKLDHEDPDFAAVVNSGQSTEADDLVINDPSTQWTRFVLGIDAALDAYGGEVAAVAAADPQHFDDESTDLDQPLRMISHRASRGDSFGRPAPATSGAVLLRLQDATGSPGGYRRDFDHDADSVSSDPARLTTAALGSALAVRLLTKTSPPEPPRPRPARLLCTPGRRARVQPWPEIHPPTMRIN